MVMGEQQVLTAEAVRAAIARLAAAIGARESGVGGLVLVGLRTRGIPLAARLQRQLQEAGATVALGRLDPTLYRDDLHLGRPRLEPTDIPVDLDGRRVVLVDDVLFTGRTIRAALDAVMDHGRPARVELAVLIDRGHRELPICPDHVGHTLSTRREQHVSVRLVETDGRDEVVIADRRR
jgi:pyrimidine operon attenuation protein / uracil phosphoribosyltransferase